MSLPQGIVLWCGSAPNQRALACKISKELPLSGIVIEKKAVFKKQYRIKTLLRNLTDRIRFRELYNSWSEMMNKYNKEYPEWPATEILVTENINSPEVIRFTQKTNHSLVMVSGTSLIKEGQFKINNCQGIINLHTGISPYIKGGPNCTNWCLATGQFHLIGNTVMWLDSGIDSGNIIATERTILSGEEDLLSLHIKVMESAHELYLKSAKAIMKDPASIPGISQKEIADGITYFSKMWNAAFKKSALANLTEMSSAIKSGEVAKKAQNIRLIQLPR